MIDLKRVEVLYWDGNREVYDVIAYEKVDGYTILYLDYGESRYLEHVKSVTEMETVN